MVDMHVRFERDTVEMLKFIAYEHGTSVAEVIRNCVNDSLGITRLEQQTSDTIEEMSERITERRLNTSKICQGSALLTCEALDKKSLI